jgi:hypothetical protein
MKKISDWIPWSHYILGGSVSVVQTEPDVSQKGFEIGNRTNKKFWNKVNLHAFKNLPKSSETKVVEEIYIL